MPGNFVDTNVILYLASSDTAKADRAEALLRDTPIVSVQVLNEIANACRRKFAFSFPELNEFLAMVKMLAAVAPIDLAVHESGLELAERYRLSVYDAMIVASALSSGCSTLYTEDMHHGLVVRDVLKIVNPFADI